MAQLDVTRAYQEGEILLQSDLDTFLDEIEDFVNVTKLNDDNFQTGGITASTKLIDGTITAAVIGTGEIQSDKINDLAVTTAKILNANVTTNKILDANVTTAKFATGAVVNANILNGAVTAAKRASLNYALSNSSSTFTMTGASETDVTNLTCNLTTNGRPVRLICVPDGTTDASYFKLHSNTGGGALGIIIKFYRDATVIHETRFDTYTDQAPSNDGRYYITSLFQTIDLDAAAGTYTYKVSVSAPDGNTIKVYYTKLLAFEVG